MKEFIITPKYKKSLLEITIWNKTDETGSYTVRHELWWRTGRFSVSVPETTEEKVAWAEIHDYGLDELEHVEFLPNEDDEEIDLDDYFAEMLDCDDGTYEEFSLTKHPDDADDEIIEEIEEGLSDEAEEYLDENGWELGESSFVITNGVTITEAN